MATGRLGKLGAFLLGVFSLVVALPLQADDSLHFATQYGLGPDKWASAWLLSQHAAPDADLTIRAAGASLPARAIPFDHPEAELRRAGGQSTFSTVRTRYGIDDPVVERLGEIIHEVEVAFWDATASPEAVAFEDAFRRLQRRNGRESVSAECYLRFYDSVADALEQTPKGRPIPAETLVQDCALTRPAPSAERTEAVNPVREVNLDTLLAAMRQGQEVVFVDVRERPEYRESRIPGARNLPIREVDSESIAAFVDADFVVSYCVKDFRGFEMAKRLERAGVRNSVIMKPYGIRGWTAAGLPLAGADALDEPTAERRLERCLENNSCLGGGT